MCACVCVYECMQIKVIKIASQCFVVDSINKMHLIDSNSMKNNKMKNTKARTKTKTKKINATRTFAIKQTMGRQYVLYVARCM